MVLLYLAPASVRPFDCNESGRAECRWRHIHLDRARAAGKVWLQADTIVSRARRLTRGQNPGRSLIRRIMSFINAFFAFLAVFFIRTRPASPEASGGGRGPWVDKAVMKESGFWSISISLVVATLGYG